LQGKRAIDGLERGILGGLSIGQVSNKDALVTGICKKIDPFEVSICATPGRDGSYIERFGTGGVMYEVCPFHVSQFSNVPPQTKVQHPRKHTNMDNSNNSRIGGTPSNDVLVNASAEAAEYLQFCTDNGIAPSYALKTMKDLKKQADEAQKLVLDDIYADVKDRMALPREALDSLGDLPLQILASAHGKFKDSQMGFKEAEQMRAAAEERNKAKIDELERANKDLVTKLGEQSKAPALATQDERYVPAVAQQVATGDVEVNASAGHVQRHTAGAVAVRGSSSIFDSVLTRPVSNPFGLDFGAMAKRVKTSGFQRDMVTDAKYIG
jgi:hypothetical protein